MYYIKDKTSSSPDIEQKASAMFANTLPTNVNAERICVENTLMYRKFSIGQASGAIHIRWIRVYQ